jgi:hypothetical protein
MKNRVLISILIIAAGSTNYAAASGQQGNPGFLKEFFVETVPAFGARIYKTLPPLPAGDTIREAASNTCFFVGDNLLNGTKTNYLLVLASVAAYPGNFLSGKNALLFQAALIAKDIWYARCLVHANNGYIEPKPFFGLSEKYMLSVDKKHQDKGNLMNELILVTVPSLVCLGGSLAYGLYRSMPQLVSPSTALNTASSAFSFFSPLAARLIG